MDQRFVMSKGSEALPITRLRVPPGPVALPTQHRVSVAIFL